MYMGDVVGWTLIVSGLLVVLNSYWIGTHALFPELTERSRENYDRPFRMFFLGLVLVLPLGFGAAIAMSNPQPLIKLPGIGLILALILGGMAGSAGLAARIGEGLPSTSDESAPWRRNLRGGVVLAATFGFPFLGWFVVSVFTLVSGFGSLVMSAWQLRKSEKQSAATTAADDAAMQEAA